MKHGAHIGAFQREGRARQATGAAVMACTGKRRVRGTLNTGNRHAWGVADLLRGHGARGVDGVGQQCCEWFSELVLAVHRMYAGGRADAGASRTCWR